MDIRKVNELIKELRSKYGFSFEKYRDSLKARESSGRADARVENKDPMKSAYGQYQFTPARLVDLGFSKDEINHIREGSQKGQRLADEALRRQVAYSYDKSKDTIGNVLSSNPQYNIYGALASIHLGGEGGLLDIANNAELKADKFGTTPLDYMEEFSKIPPENIGLDEENLVSSHLQLIGKNRPEVTIQEAKPVSNWSDWRERVRRISSFPESENLRPSAEQPSGEHPRDYYERNIAPFDRLTRGIINTARKGEHPRSFYESNVAPFDQFERNISSEISSGRFNPEIKISDKEIKEAEQKIEEAKASGAEVDEVESFLDAMKGQKSERERLENINRFRSLMNSFYSIRNMRESKDVINDVNRQLKQLKAPQAPNIPAVSPGLRRAYDNSLMNVARPISPAEMEAMSRMSSDNFLQQRGIASVSSGGQGGAFGSMMQRAAIGRDRANLAMQNQVAESRRAALNQNMQLGGMLDNAETQRASLRAGQFDTASRQYLSRAMMLDQAKMNARMNLANSRNTFAQVLPHALSNLKLPRLGSRFNQADAAAAVASNTDPLSLEGGQIYDNLNVDSLRELNSLENMRLNNMFFNNRAFNA